MAAPPEKKKKESTTISMVVEQWGRGQTEQHSAIHRINGYPWRLMIVKGYGSRREVKLVCEKSNEAELWMCKPKIKNPPYLSFRRFQEKPTFSSWGTRKAVLEMKYGHYNKIKTVGTVLEVELELIDDDGEKWRPLPILDHLHRLDGILVIGKDKRKISVNKTSLASQSSFFDRLFFGDFKEKNMNEIAIGDVEYEEFNNLFKIIYGQEGITLSDDNVFKVLQLADRFDLKIVEDVCVNFFLSNASSIPIHQKLLFAEENDLPFLKDGIISQYTTRHLRDLIDSPDWEVLSKETTKALMKKCCDLADLYDSTDSEDDHMSNLSESERDE